jgi:hypothetical protein
MSAMLGGGLPRAMPECCSRGTTQENLALRWDLAVSARRSRRRSDQLGSPNLDVRLGGIDALERIARDSMRDHIVNSTPKSLYASTVGPRTD